MSVMHTDPVLSCEESLEFEKKYFRGWGTRVQSMNKAGQGVGDAY